MCFSTNGGNAIIYSKIGLFDIGIEIVANIKHFNK